MSRICAFLVVSAVIAALVGCTESTVSEYTLTISATEGGSVTDPGMGPFTYEFGEVVSLVAGADPGYQFVKWTGDVRTVDDVDSAETTVTVRADYSITASFEAAPIVHFDLTVSSTAGGSVTAPGEGTFTYEADTVVDLIAVADECYEFTGWTGDTDGIADPYSPGTTISITIGELATRTITANFARLRYRLTIATDDFGLAISPGTGTFTYDCGTVVRLVATTADRYRFVGWSGDISAIASPYAASTTIIMNDNYSIRADREVIPMVAVGREFTLGLKSDGTVLAVGSNWDGQCDVDGWTDIKYVAAGGQHSVGLRHDGTVVATGSNSHGQINVADWSDIVQLVAGTYFTVGLRADGTVVATGDNKHGQCEVGDWIDIVQLAASACSWHTVGLRADGTAIATGGNCDGQSNLGDWTEVTQVAAGGYHSVGLRPDGTVLALGRNEYGERSLGSWTDIVQIAAGCHMTLGLTANNKAVASGWNTYGQCDVGNWTDVVQIAAGYHHTAGLRSDGTVVTAGSNSRGQRNVDDWILG